MWSRLRKRGFALRNARAWDTGRIEKTDVFVRAGRVVGAMSPSARLAHLDGRIILPGLVNGHDHLDFSVVPPLGRPPYASVYEWAASVRGGAGDPASEAALRVPLADRLFMGGLRNLLAGVTAVAHHNPFDRTLAQERFPVRVLHEYDFAHSPGLSPDLAGTRRSTSCRVRWMIHAGEGTDARCRQEIQALAEDGFLQPNTVIVHAIACGPEDASLLAAARASVIWCPESNRHLYGVSAPARLFRSAGVRIGLGSDSPASGVRDALTNLLAAREERVFDDHDLLVLATNGTAEAVGLPVGGFEPGAPADFVVVNSIEKLLDGTRPAIDLVVVAGKPLYGEPGLMSSLDCDSVAIEVDGAKRRLEANTGRRAAAILSAHPALSGVPWIKGLAIA